MRDKKLTVTLTMTREEAEAVQTACEMYLRLHMGQFWDLCDDLCMSAFHDGKRRGYASKDQEDAAFRECLAHRDAMRDGMERLYRAHSMPSGLDTLMQLPYRAEIVWLTIRHALAWHDHPEGGTSVNFYPPFNRSDQPGPKIKLHEKNNGE